MSQQQGATASKVNPVGDVAGRYISKMQRLYRQDDSAAVAELAALRRGVGKPAYEDFNGGGHEALEDLAEILDSPERKPQRRDSRGAVTEFGEYLRVRRERAEDTLYLALTLWALHQQSLRDENMHVPGRELGRSVRELAAARAGGDASAEVSETLRKRFVRLGTSATPEMLAVRLRELIILLRDERIPLDYRLLADQLYLWQDESRQAHVRRAWGRSFHRGAPRREETGRGRPADERPQDRESGE